MASVPLSVQQLERHMAASAEHTEQMKGSAGAFDMHASYSQGPRQRGRKRGVAVEHKTQPQVPIPEDKRVQELTASVLYEFLPAALHVVLPHCDDPSQELDAARCRAVAGAALAVATLLNAPPGFLEFLLCVPWRKLTHLYPKSDTIDKLISNLHVTEEERRRLVNVHLEPVLMRVVLDFLYRPDHVHSLPPMMALTDPTGQAVDLLSAGGASGPVITLETVAALLDGCTPLHCAALRGSPGQVEHLLSCGANPAVKNAAGEVPIQLVPVCGYKQVPGVGRVKQCNCMSESDQERWGCKSRLARSLIARRCAVIGFRLLGFWTWLGLLGLCLLCLMGVWGNYTTICRPVIEQHVIWRRERKRQGARMRAQSLMSRMRSEAKQGQVHLATAKQEAVQSRAGGSTGAVQRTGCRADSRSGGGQGVGVADKGNGSGLGNGSGTLPGAQAGLPSTSAAADVIDLTFSSKSPPPKGAPPATVHDINVHLKESEAINSAGEEQASELAFKCFVRAVHALQSLDLQGDTIPQVLHDLEDTSQFGASNFHVLEDEQAELYCCWAESVLLKFGRTCTCPGCAALAVQAVRMAHGQTSKLYQRAVQKYSDTDPESSRSVGYCLARVVHVYISLLLESEVQASPTRACVWRAEQCLREWDRLAAAGLTSGFTEPDLVKVTSLRLWARTADSDLYIAEALLGSMLSPQQSLQEVLAMTVTYSATGMPYLIRAPTAEMISQLDQAITLALLPSPSLAALSKALLRNSSQELELSAGLRGIMSGARTPSLEDSAESVTALKGVVQAAEAFPRLSGDLAICSGILDKWSARADAVGKLMSVIDDVKQFTDSHPLLPTQTPLAAQTANPPPPPLVQP